MKKTYRHKLFILKVVKLVALILALSSTSSSTKMMSSNVLEVISLPPYSPNITVTYRWESLSFLYTELTLLILGEVLVWFFLVRVIYCMFSKKHDKSYL